MSDAINRRQFLRTTAAASGATLAATRALAARGGTSANEQLIVAVMGTNGRGSALTAQFAGLADVEVAYICDVDSKAVAKGVAAGAKEQSRPPQGVEDFRRVLDDPAVDALVIAAPDHWHAPATLLACAAGKHVYVEKPASHNGAEGEMMVAAARKHNRVVQLGTQRRSSLQISDALAGLRAGELGRVLFARGWINSTRPTIGYGKSAAVPGNLNYDLWQGPAPTRPYRDNVIHYHWHWFWHWGTGELGNNGIHALDLCRWGLGVEYPTHVVCGGGKFYFDDDQETPDTQIATFHFGDKAINWEHRTWHRRGFEGQDWGAAFYGEQGTLVVGSNECVTYDMDGNERNRVSIDRGDAAHLRNFVDTVHGEAKLNAEIAEGVKSTLLCHLGNIAYRCGQTVHFDADTRTVAGNDDAKALWGREYRPGWEPVV